MQMSHAGSLGRARGRAQTPEARAEPWKLVRYRPQILVATGQAREKGLARISSQKIPLASAGQEFHELRSFKSGNQDLGGQNSGSHLPSDTSLTSANKGPATTSQSLSRMQTGFRLTSCGADQDTAWACRRNGCGRLVRKMETG